MVRYTHISWNHDTSTPRSKNKLMLIMITIPKRRLPGNDKKMHRTFLLYYSIKVNKHWLKIKNAGGRTVIRQIHNYCFDQEKEWMREHLRFDIDRQKRVSKIFQKLEGRITNKIK